MECADLMEWKPMAHVKMPVFCAGQLHGYDDAQVAAKSLSKIRWTMQSFGTLSCTLVQDVLERSRRWLQCHHAAGRSYQGAYVIATLPRDVLSAKTLAY